MHTNGTRKAGLIVFFILQRKLGAFVFFSDRNVGHTFSTKKNKKAGFSFVGCSMINIVFKNHTQDLLLWEIF